MDPLEAGGLQLVGYQQRSGQDGWMSFRILLNLLNSRCRSCSLSACALGTYSVSWTHFSSAMMGECGLMGCGEDGIWCIQQ